MWYFDKMFEAAAGGEVGPAAFDGRCGRIDE
jgi:hypothetical protein